MEKVVAAPSESTSFRSNLAGKYLTFALANEGYGVPVLKVHEIITMLHITMVPQMPPYVKGVINLRGKVKGAVKSLLDIDKVIAADKIKPVAELF